LKIQVKIFEKEEISEYYITVSPASDQYLQTEIQKIVAEIRELAREKGFHILQERAFGTNEALQLLDKELGGRGFIDEGPITLLEVPCNQNGQLSCVQIHAIAGIGIDTQSLIFDGIPVGRITKYCDKSYITLSNVSFPVIGDYLHQTESMFEQMDRILKSIGIDASHIARTWMWLDNILDYYDVFNKARNDYFAKCNISKTMKMPASTGVGVKPYNGALCTMDLIAIGSPDKIEYFQKSKNQNSAYDYGSAFSRVTKTQAFTGTKVFVSGTASISKTGETEHIGDPKAQIAATIENIKAIMSEAGCTEENMSHVIAYCKDRDIEEEYLKSKPDGWEITTVIADVCRNNLLFEIEAAATVTN